MFSSMMWGMSLNFLQLNVDWNAEPNAPDPHVEVTGQDVLLRFHVNPFQFKDFAEDEIGFLRFVNCLQYRLGPTNDEGWYHGQCRFSKIAPKWGEFYEVVGDDGSTLGPTDWRAVSTKSTSASHHFLFYFRDHTFECIAETCVLEVRDDNALTVKGKRIPAFAKGR
jgi:hypothetical protein